MTIMTFLANFASWFMAVYQPFSGMGYIALPSSNPNDFEEQFRKEAVLAWVRAHQELRQGAQILIEKDGSGGSVEIKEESIWHADQKSKVVFSKNDRYKFRIEKLEQNSTSSQYRLVQLMDVSSRDNSPLSQVISNLEYQYGRIRENIGGTTLVFEPLSEVVLDPRFKIESAARQPFRGLSCVVIEWQFKQNSDDAEIDFPAAGTFWFAPEMDWAILKFEWFLYSGKPDQYQMKGQFFDYKEFGNIQVPSRLEYTYTGEVPSQVIQESLSFSFDRMVDSDKFFLPYYGLPEPKGFRVKANPVVYVLVGALMFLVLGVVFSAISKKKNQV